ncbi:VOC family protein, partial [bacterium]|nr:VOC family protein [bacterium]
MLDLFHSVLLHVSDIEASLSYYKDKLGFAKVFDYSKNGGVAGLKIGKTYVILYPDGESQPGYLPSPGERGRGVILQFEVDNVDSYHDMLKEMGVEISQQPQDMTFGLMMMYVFDPDGY